VTSVHLAIGRRRTGVRHDQESAEHRNLLLLTAVTGASGNDLETFLLADAVDRKILAIGREDEIGIQVFCERDDGRIRVVHRYVSVALDEIATSTEYRPRLWDEEGAPRDEEVEARSPPTDNATE
jgi:hypothetical protein